MAAKRLHHEDGMAMTIDEFLAFEQNSQVRHEYVNGHVFAMGGTSAAHSGIMVNLVLILGSAAKKKPGCRLYIESMFVKAGSSLYYPDLVYSCEPIKPTDLVLKAPRLIIEVLSPSTERTDKAEKVEAYQRISSLSEYAIVSQTTRKIEVYRRSEERWICSDYESGLLTLESIPLEVSLTDIYDETGV